MELYVVFVYLVFVAGFQDVDAELICLACTDSPRPRDCQYTTRCGPHQTCFTDTYRTTLGTLRYRMGCRDTLKCNVKGTVLGGGATSTVAKCSECCHGNLCNSAICGAEKGYLSVPLTSRGPICFSCDQQRATDSCHVIKECRIQEECMLQQYETQVGHDLVYRTDCVPVSKCDENICRQQNQTLLVHNLIGRQSKSDTCSYKCCRDDLCNDNCQGDQVAFTSPTAALMPVISTRTASTTHEASIRTASTSSATSFISSPDAAFCRNKDDINCGLDVELCTVNNAIGESHVYMNRCIVKKAMCIDRELTLIGCRS